jgi:hypothetical protein
MERELFIESIKALKNQYEYDNEFAKKLSQVFTNAFEANLLPENHLIRNALMKILQVENNDLELGDYGQSWIEYFCFELDFGVEYKDGMITDKGKNIDFSDSGKLWDYLNNR